MSTLPEAPTENPEASPAGHQPYKHLQFQTSSPQNFRSATLCFVRQLECTRPQCRGKAYTLLPLQVSLGLLDPQDQQWKLSLLREKQMFFISPQPPTISLFCSVSWGKGLPSSTGLYSRQGHGCAFSCSQISSPLRP